MRENSHTSDVHAFLYKCTESMIHYIELQLQFAGKVRQYQSKYSVSNEEFAKEFQCEVNYVINLRKGATEISLADIAKLRTLCSRRIVKNNIKASVK